jgi:hypothetical protein
MQPTLGDPFEVARDVHVIPTYWPVPNIGSLPMNAFVIRGAEPVLVDSGAAVLSDEFMDALASIVAPEDLRWIWLTHEDRDHTGSLRRVLDAAPRARLVANFFAVGRMFPEGPIPLDRLRLVNAGETLNIGDRNLLTIRPPLFDSPATTGFLDDRSGVLVTSDCFGAPLPTYEEAAVRSVSELEAETVAANQVAWATVDMPWVTKVDRDLFGRELDLLGRMEPRTVLSSHLPPIHDHFDDVLKTLSDAPVAAPVSAMTQVELEALLAQFEV